MTVRLGCVAGWITVLAAAIALESSTVAAGRGGPAIMTGGRFAYTTVSGDSLTIVGARYGVEPRVIANLNDLSPTSRLRVGQTLTIDNRHLIPEPFPAAITINIPQRVLFLVDGVSVSTRGEIVYRPILLARADDGTVWLEAHSDVYHRSRDGLAVVRELASYEELEAEMDWMAVRAALQTRQGTPIDVTRRTMPAGTRSR